MTRRIVFQLLIMHAILSIVHLLANNFGHPLVKYLVNWSVSLQVLVLSLIALLIYMGAGALYSAIKEDKRILSLSIERICIYITLLFMAIYAITYFIALQFQIRDVMLLYTMFNPWFGTFMLRLSNEKFYSLWWMVGTIIPGLGIYLGTKLCLWNREVH